MLEDRSPSVKSAKNAAESLMRGLNPQEQKGIQNQVAQLDRRWETVCATSRDRLDILEEMLGLSKDFQDLHEPLTSWLDSRIFFFNIAKNYALIKKHLHSNSIKSLENLLL